MTRLWIPKRGSTLYTPVTFSDLITHLMCIIQKFETFKDTARQKTGIWFNNSKYTVSKCYSSTPVINSIIKNPLSNL